MKIKFDYVYAFINFYLLNKLIKKFSFGQKDILFN